MFIGLYMLKSITAESVSFENNFISNFPLNSNIKLKPKSNPLKDMKKTRLVTLTSDNNKQITVDLNKSSFKLQQEISEMANQVKTNANKFFYSKEEMYKQFENNRDLLDDDEINGELKAEIKKHNVQLNVLLLDYYIFRGIGHFMNYLNNLYVLKHEFKDQLKEYLGKDFHKANITEQIKLKGILNHSNDLIVFFYKLGSKFNNVMNNKSRSETIIVKREFFTRGENFR